MKYVFYSLVFWSIGLQAISGEDFTFKKIDSELMEYGGVHFNNNDSIAGTYYDEPSIKNYYWSEQQGYVFIPRDVNINDFARINNNNDVVNISFDKQNGVLAKKIFIFNPDGTVEEINPPAGWENDFFVINDINDNREILLSKKQFNKPPQYAVWQNGAYRSLDHLNFEEVFSINNNGIILGTITDQYKQVLYNLGNDTLTEINGAVDAVYVELNDLNEVIYTRIHDSIYDPVTSARALEGFFVDSENNAVSLGRFSPRSINNNGQILGVEKIDGEENTILLDMKKDFEKTNLAVKTTEIAEQNPDWNIVYVEINDKGTILGRGLREDTSFQQFFLVPIAPSEQ